MLLQQAAMVTLVVTLMLSIGLRTDAAALRAVTRQAGPLGAALVTNLLLVPALAAGVAWLWGLAPPVAAGLVLCAACPGGPSGPLFASRARGDLPVAAAAAVGLAVLGVVSAPATVGLLLGRSVDVDVAALVGPMMATLGAVQLLPLGLGVAVRWRWPERASRWAGPAERLANGVLLAVILGMIAARGDALWEIGGRGLVATATVVLASLGMGALTPGGAAVRRSLALVTCVRSLSLALLLSTTWLPDPRVDAAVLTYGLFAMLVPFGASWWLGPAQRVRAGASIGGGR